MPKDKIQTNQELSVGIPYDLDLKNRNKITYETITL